MLLVLLPIFISGVMLSSESCRHFSDLCVETPVQVFCAGRVFAGCEIQQHLCWWHVLGVTTEQVCMVNAGLLSSESDFAPPQARSRPGVHMTGSSTVTPVYVPVTQETQESSGAGKHRPWSNGRRSRATETGHMQSLNPLHNPVSSTMDENMNGKSVGALAWPVWQCFCS
jgi:hypothetical protein